MSKKIDFRLKKSGVIELFKSPEVNAWLQQVGDSVAETASNMSGNGAEYGARAHNAGKTAIVNVYPANEEAAIDNYQHNTLMKALGASGLPETKPKL